MTTRGSTQHRANPGTNAFSDNVAEFAQGVNSEQPNDDAWAPKFSAAPEGTSTPGAGQNSDLFNPWAGSRVPMTGVDTTTTPVGQPRYPMNDYHAGRLGPLRIPAAPTGPGA